MALDYLGNTMKTSGTDEKSPCIGTCRYDHKERCVGCFRTAKEITDWFTMTNEEKRKLKEKIHARRNP
jgi:predicted Fe-S protein YdhL (DUF1289 family)